MTDDSKYYLIRSDGAHCQLNEVDNIKQHDGLEQVVVIELNNSFRQDAK